MEPSETNSISRDQSETFNTKDCQYATNQKASSICCESDIYYPEGKDSQIYVWDISQLWITRKQRGSQQKNRKYEDIGVESESCSNTRGSIGMRLSFGELCRVGTLRIVKRTSEEFQCNYVYAIHEHENGGDGPVFKMSESSERNESEGVGPSVSMVVFTFVDESVRRNIAASIHITLVDSKDLEKHDDFYESIAEFGFEHIIVVGETHNGLLFLDCYGRVFKWQEIQQSLWPLGNSIEDVELKLKSNKRLDRTVWTVEYGVLVSKELPDYDLETAERARKTRTKGVKNKHLKNKKK